jgi:hypothetical protein
MSLQPHDIEGVQALQQLGLIRQVSGVDATVLDDTTQLVMDSGGHCTCTTDTACHMVLRQPVVLLISSCQTLHGAVPSWFS